MGKDLEKNVLRVAFDDEKAPGLYAQRTIINGISFVNKSISQKCSILAKARYRDPMQEIEYRPIDETTAEVVFKHPQRALATGQVIAFYEEDVLLGGGFYQEIDPLIE